MLPTCAASQSRSLRPLTRLVRAGEAVDEGHAAHAALQRGEHEMTGRRCSTIAALTFATLFGLAGQAFADGGALEAATSMPIARIILGLASVAFTAVLARSAAH